MNVISVDQVKQNAAKPYAILDVRHGGVTPGQVKAQGSQVLDPEAVKSWENSLSKDKSYLLYCS